MKISLPVALVTAVVLLTGCGADAPKNVSSMSSPGNAAPASPDEAPSVQGPGTEQLDEAEPGASKRQSQAACRASGPVMNEVMESVSRATEGIITADEGAAALLRGQQQLDALADGLADPAVGGSIHGLADGVGKMRVAIIERDDSGAAGQAFQAAGRRMLDACREVLQ